MDVQLYFGIISTVAYSLELTGAAEPLPPVYTGMIERLYTPSRNWFPDIIGGVRVSRKDSDIVSGGMGYWGCTRRCARRPACVAMSYHAGMKVCVLSFEVGAVEEEAVGYVLSRKSTWDTSIYQWCDDRCETGRTCHASGGCGKEVCPVPANPANGKVLGNMLTNKKTIAYTCDPGFTLTSGDVKRTCTGGDWNGTAATCSGQFYWSAQGQAPPMAPTNP